MLRVYIKNLSNRINRRQLSYEALKYTTHQITPKSDPAKPLTDLFGRHHTYLRISITERCNLRCQYCMPAEGVQLSKKEHLLTSDEIIYLAQLFVNEGVKKIRITGGEPTVRKDLLPIIENLKNIKGVEELAMTTNGLVLTRQLVALQRAGLDIVNISLDTLKPERYERVTRRKGWERVIMGIDLAAQLGYNPVKINCVVIKGFNDDEIINFVEFTKDRNVDVRFIEYMPFTGNRWDSEKMIPYRDMVAKIQEEFPNFAPLENKPNDTSKAWKVPGFKGQIGFITSMSEHFCGSCNRLRITADGNLKVCLFGNTEVSLRDAMRSGCREDDLVALINSAVKRKKKQHAVSLKSPKIHMNYHPLMWKGSVNLTSARAYSTESLETKPKKLSHVNDEGKAKMVDVSGKDNTTRSATAQAIIRVNYEISDLIKNNAAKKGDVLTIAQLAGIMGAKKTSELIPLCHNIVLTKISVVAKLNYACKEVVIEATVNSVGKTGVEMEALTAVSLAALTVYDMCKSVSHDIIISNISLLHKSGGASGIYDARTIGISDNNGTQDPSYIFVGSI